MSTGTGVPLHRYECSILKVRAYIELMQYRRRYGYGRSTYVSTATKNVIASIFGSKRSPAYP